MTGSAPMTSQHAAPHDAATLPTRSRSSADAGMPHAFRDATTPPKNASPAPAPTTAKHV
jgi:hypothetical protein